MYFSNFIYFIAILLCISFNISLMKFTSSQQKHLNYCLNYETELSSQNHIMQNQFSIVNLNIITLLYRKAKSSYVQDCQLIFLNVFRSLYIDACNHNYLQIPCKNRWMTVCVYSYVQCMYVVLCDCAIWITRWCSNYFVHKRTNKLTLNW